MPALRHNSAEQSLPAWGLTWLRPANIVGSDRIDVARIHALGPGRASATSSAAMTSAAAPSLDGHVSTKRIGSHNIGDSMAASSVQSGSWRWA